MPDAVVDKSDNETDCKKKKESSPEKNTITEDDKANALSNPRR